MKKHFGSAAPMAGLHINGKASLGENIADYGGVLLGLDAFKKTAQYKTGKPIGGLTPGQNYFLRHAPRGVNPQPGEGLRPGALVARHPPAEGRVGGRPAPRPAV